MAPESRWPHLADAADVEQWANRIGARTELPRLVRTLIRQTNDQVVTLEMRAGEGGEAPGYDGVVEATRKTPFVPAGKTVWELGSGADPRDKANEDYRARTNDPLDAVPAETTFVFVTPRRWRDKNDWAAKKRADGVWANVVAFDVDDIELALESAPAAHFWFSERIGKPASSVQSIEDWWSRYSELSSPALTPVMVLGGRQDEAAELLRILDQPRQVTTVSAASTDDVLAFVAATVLTSPESTRLDALARTLIVRDAVSLRQLDSVKDLFVLLPFEDDLRREAQLVRSHHVILLAPVGVPADIALPPIERTGLAEELGRAGVPEERARVLAEAAHRGLLAFQRQSPARGKAPLPEWTALVRSKTIRRAWLAGAWSERRSGDTEVLGKLLGMSYEDAREELTRASEGADPLMSVTGDSWKAISPDQSWSFLKAKLAPADLTALEETVQVVLGAVDPALDLPASERWRAAIHGKTRIHSADLRTGLATTLALAGAYGHDCYLSGGATVRSWSEATVHSLFRRANDDPSGQLWASLSDVLPLVAEAAPDVFLRAVEAGLSGDDPLVSTLFVDQYNGISVSSPHTGLLWALEGLAWSADYLGLAVRLLARLAEIDPGGRLSNRPQATLVDIFRPWLPQTSASAEQRIAVLDGMCSVHPSVCWSLLVSLLPEQHDVGMYTHAPTFRDWKPEGDVKVSVREFWQFSLAVAERLLDMASTDPKRWVDLIERIPDFPPDQKREAMKRLETLARDQ